MIKTKNITISNYINTNYREYALYTLMHRGIPHFDDGLTNVQRMIILNSTETFNKTMSSVGKVISDGYHHGDASVGKSASKLARPYGCSHQILEGDGFFGNSVKPEASSPRYTSIALNKEVQEYIKRYKHLNTKNVDDVYEALHLELPIGLFTTIVGIAVGYKTTILPRKPQDIKNFLLGKRKSVPPYFQNFSGKISPFKDLENAWLFEGVCDINNKDHTISITAIPPLMSYKTFVNKLNGVLENCNVKLDNNTNDVINIKIKFNVKEEWDNTIDEVVKMTKQIVRENIVFIKENKVFEYDSIENYLTDFKRLVLETEIKDCGYQVNYFKNEIEFQKAKKEFMLFLKKEKVLLSSEKIEEFLKQYSTEIYQRLDRIPLRKLNKDEVDTITIKIDEYTKNVNTFLSSYNKKLEQLENMDKFYHTKKYATTEINIDEINDIEVFNIDEEIIQNIEE